MADDTTFTLPQLQSAYSSQISAYEALKTTMPPAAFAAAYGPDYDKLLANFGSLASIFDPDGKPRDQSYIAKASQIQQEVGQITANALPPEQGGIGLGITDAQKADHVFATAVAQVQGQTARDVAGIQAGASENVAGINSASSKYSADLSYSANMAGLAVKNKELDISAHQFDKNFDLQKETDDYKRLVDQWQAQIQLVQANLQAQGLSLTARGQDQLFNTNLYTTDSNLVGATISQETIRRGQDISGRAGDVGAAAQVADATGALAGKALDSAVPVGTGAGIQAAGRAYTPGELATGRDVALTGPTQMPFNPATLVPDTAASERAQLSGFRPGDMPATGLADAAQAHVQQFMVGHPTLSPFTTPDTTPQALPAGQAVTPTTVASAPQSPAPNGNVDLAQTDDGSFAARLAAIRASHPADLYRELHERFGEAP